MQKDELYQIINHHCVDRGRNLCGHVIIIDDIKKCTKICSGHDGLTTDPCRNQWVKYHVLYESINVQYDECAQTLERASRAVLSKPVQFIEIMF